MGFRPGKGKTKDIYLVKWLGYGEEENTWEPRDNIAQDVIDEYWKKRLPEPHTTKPKLRQPKKLLAVEGDPFPTYYLAYWSAEGNSTWEPKENLPKTLIR